MSDIFVPDLIEETAAGIFARHAARATLPVLTAPTTPERPDATNRVRQHLVTVACSNLTDRNFAFDSSVIDPEFARGFERLAKLVSLYPDSPLTLFGHADPEGPAGEADSYNKFLSERRARAVYALLLRRTEIWEQLHSDAAERSHVRGDDWGLKSLQVMLDALGFTPGNLDGKPDKVTDDALADFVGSVTGTRPARAKNDVATRALLFRAYMDFLTPPDPANPQQKFQLPPERFLNGAKGKIEGPGDFQGCSAFNLQLILARQELDALAKEGDIGKASRHGLNEPNRRVILFLFAPGTVMPETWPCPSAKKGVADCHARFWSDGEKRRGTAFPQHRRRFGKAVPESKAVLVPANPSLAARMRKPETTFACRFYHGLAVGSPCERDLKMWILRLHAGGPTRPIADVRYVARMGTDAAAPVIRGRTTAAGTLGLPVYDDVATISLRIDAFRLLFGTLPPKPANPPAPPPAQPTDSTDPEAFPDEADFLEVTLNAGALDRIRLPANPEPPPPGPGDPPPAPDFDTEDAPPLTTDERDRGAGERLQNLGFGDRELILDAAARRDAIRSFQRFVLKRTPDKATGDLDDETLDRLATEYGDAKVTESPPT